MAGLVTCVLTCLLAGSLQALAGGWPGSSLDAASPAIDHPLLAPWAWLLQTGGAALFCAALLSRPATRLRDAVCLAAAFGFSGQAGAIWWLHIGMHKYAGLAAPLSLAAVVALSLYLASYTVLAVAWFQRSRRHIQQRLTRHPTWQGVATAGAFAGAWLLAELGRAMVMTGFPWAVSGYAHLHGPFRGVAPWLGVYGAGALAAFVAALVAQLGVGLLRGARQAVWRQLIAVAALTAALAAMTTLPDARFTQSSGEFDVVLLQGNVSQDGKFEQSRISEALNWYSYQLARSQADLTLTPETAFAVLEQTLPEAYWARLRQRVQALPGALLVGMPRGEPPLGQYNALLGLAHADTLVDPAPDGLYRYDKAHLVPFAEFTPPGFAWFTTGLNLPLPTFLAGPPAARPLRIRTRSGAVQTIAPLICFEDLYGEEMALRFRQPESVPTVFANASNLAWFDNASALPQHLRIAQYRSLEFQRPTVRATNTGPTVVIDHQGQVTRALQVQTQGSLAAVVDGRTGITPYAWWVSRTGLWPLVGLGLLLLIWPLAPFKPKAGSREPEPGHTEP